MMATENFSFLVDAHAAIAQKAVAFKTIKLQSFLFAAQSTMWRIFFPLAAVSLHYFHHLLIKKVRWEAVNVAVRTFGDLTTFRTTQLSFPMLLYPTFQASLAESVETFQYFWFIDLTKMLLTNRTFQFFLDIIEKALTLCHYFFRWTVRTAAIHRTRFRRNIAEVDPPNWFGSRSQVLLNKQ